ncbi:hypothetical protein [Romboutsia sp. 1001713B170207_170306_H8]|uniref:hypothetical protein n=1 Tax=Romboutsia sp. 1001713B170207_170306_H8 TaxID=2787112 RepID=UPI00189A34F5|nr:hypothetical protein [Romboutsia sp. 1001713B170207_170306_H8]
MKGSVERACIDILLKVPKNIKTVKYKKIEKARLLREIKAKINEGKSYIDIAIELEIHTIDVLNILQEEIIFGINLTKGMIEHLISKGITISEISELYKCKKVNIIYALNDINNNISKNKAIEIETAIKINDLLENNIGFDFISKSLKIDEYKVFTIYNKYFHKYNNNVISFNQIEELIKLNLSDVNIARFYSINEDDMNLVKEQIKYNKQIRKSKIDDKNKDNLSMIEKSYKESTNMDFHCIRSKNRKYK